MLKAQIWIFVRRVTPKSVHVNKESSLIYEYNGNGFPRFGGLGAYPLLPGELLMLLLLSPVGHHVAGCLLGRFWRLCPIDCCCSSSLGCFSGFRWRTMSRSTVDHESHDLSWPYGLLGRGLPDPWVAGVAWVLSGHWLGQRYPFLVCSLQKCICICLQVLSKWGRDVTQMKVNEIGSLCSKSIKPSFD